MIKPLLSTLRERKRYLAFEVLTQKKLEWQHIQWAVKNAIQEYIGTEGCARAGILFVKFNENKGVLRTNHLYLAKVRAALLFIKNIQNELVQVKSIRASGMLHRAAESIKN